MQAQTQFADTWSCHSCPPAGSCTCTAARGWRIERSSGSTHVAVICLILAWKWGKASFADMPLKPPDPLWTGARLFQSESCKRLQAPALDFKSK